MRKRIEVDLKTAAKHNFRTVSDALVELNSKIKTTNKETIDVCNDLMLHYKNRIEDIECDKDRIVHILKYNVLSRYAKECYDKTTPR